MEKDPFIPTVPVLAAMPEPRMTTYTFLSQTLFLSLSSDLQAPHQKCWFWQKQKLLTTKSGEGGGRGGSSDEMD